MQDHIDRFKIIRELGRGGQGVVYLAEDPRLDRQVALKTIDRQLTPEHGVRLLEEARMISKLRHPNIVSVYEAGDVLGKPYVVFEYVEGTSLKSLMKKEGILIVHRAVSIMIQILTGIAYAHRMGIIHRDLNPANIMIDQNSVARIMDFGLSVMSGDVHEAAGTPHYMSPEHFSRVPLTPKADIFSLGLVFYEMLTGVPAFTSDDHFALMYRIAHDPVDAPSRHNEAIDPEMDQVVLRALEKNPADRYGDADEMRHRLEICLEVEKGTNRTEEARDTHGTVEFLMRRMRHKGDLPAFSHHIVEINNKISSLAAVTFSSSGDLANIILKDVSLTNKLLRVVNSAHYGNLAGRVTTISKAVMLLGFEKLRMIASALMIFEHLQDKAQAAELKEAALGCYMSGNIAMDVAERLHLTRMEDVFICSMLYNLGRLLVICYFPEEYGEIKKRMIRKGIDETRAARSVLGISYNQLGIAVARSWNFPETIIQGMEGLPPGVVEEPKSDRETLRGIAAYANELCDVIINTEVENREQALADMSKRYQKSIPIAVPQMVGLLESAATKIDQYSEIVNVDRRSSAFIRKLILYGKAVTPECEDPGKAGRSSPRIPAEAGLNSTAAPTAPLMAEHRRILENGIQEIAEIMKGTYNLSDVVYMILELMYRGFEFNRVLFCLRDRVRSVMAARFGLGENAEALVKVFRFPIGQASDIFNIAISHAKGVAIDDARAPNIASTLPPWYQSSVAAPAFLVHPLTIKGVCIGLFYADRKRRGTLLTEAQWQYMDALRNIAVDVMTKKRGAD